MKISPVKTPIVRKAMKRAQKVLKNIQPKPKGGYFPLGNGKYIFIAGGPEIDKKVAEANKIFIK